MKSKLNKSLSVVILIIILLLVWSGSLMWAQENPDLKILIVTGGKNFEEKEFYKIFEDHESIAFDTASKPAVFELFNSDFISDYDAVLFYDTYRTTTDFEKEAFLNLFKKGIGALFLHHSLVSHQDWDEYRNIIGGKYHYNAWIEKDKKYGPSTYKHDQNFMVKTLNKEHPILSNISDFNIHDEIYINVEITENISPLLTSNNCESMKYLGWINKFMNSDVVYIQLGHDESSYKNENFRKLIYNSLYWLSKKSIFEKEQN
jgi:uncharacterized protein